MTTETEVPSRGWRYFGTREVKEARAWAAAGGVAVHENIFKSRGRRTCHLLAVDHDRLIAAATSIGCSPLWIQRTRTIHFDLVDPYLTRALDHCPNYPGHPTQRPA